MIFTNLNLLLNGYNPHMLQHGAARCWWDATLNRNERLGMPVEAASGFIRVATNPRLGRGKGASPDARRVVESGMDLPQSRLLTPGALHVTRFMDLMGAVMVAGPILSDAILAASAMEHQGGS